MNCSTRLLKGKILSWVFVLPGLVLYLSFVVYPIFSMVVLSLYDWNGIGQKLYVGFENYVKLMSDNRFHTNIRVSLLWTLGASITPVLLGLAAAALLYSRIRFRTFFRVVYYLPAVISVVAVAVLWSWIYAPYFGLLNGIMSALGFNQINFLGNANLALPSLIIAYTWAHFGFYMVILLAGLQNIDPVLYDAASVDGAGAWQKFVHVTVPMLRQPLTITSTIAIINALKTFSIIYITTGGGPYRSTETLPVRMYLTAFLSYKAGYAAAISVVFLIITFTLSVTFWRLRERSAW